MTPSQFLNSPEVAAYFEAAALHFKMEGERRRAFWDTVLRQPKPSPPRAVDPRVIRAAASAVRDPTPPHHHQGA